MSNDKIYRLTNHDSGKPHKFEAYEIAEYNKIFGTNYSSVDEACQDDPEYCYSIDEVDELSRKVVTGLTDSCKANLYEFFKNNLKNPEDLDLYFENYLKAVLDRCSDWVKGIKETSYELHSYETKNGCPVTYEFSESDFIWDNLA